MKLFLLAADCKPLLVPTFTCIKYMERKINTLTHGTVSYNCVPLTAILALIQAVSLVGKMSQKV